VLLTERQRRTKINERSFRGQIQMLLDYAERCVCSLWMSRQIQEKDTVYAVTDYWCDSLPMLLSKSRRKAMVFHMEAPTLGEILRKSRPDVEAGRLASVHYWLSQNFSLRAFRYSTSKHLFLLHPDMRSKALDWGYKPRELSAISYGVDTQTASSVTQPNPLPYDVCWIGRVHRQKGIDDLLATMDHLSQHVPHFKAILMGKVEAELRPRIESMGLSSNVEFSGFISEADKFRLFKSSRLFLMPSRHEGSPRVVGEAIVCGVPVLAYDLPTYRPVFGEYARYVPAFDFRAFCREAEQLVLESRAGRNYLDTLDVCRFREENSWECTRSVFLNALATRL
jgi:glycosyltransferase involved in cell wall biosynthesis